MVNGANKRVDETKKCNKNHSSSLPLLQYLLWNNLYWLKLDLTIIKAMAVFKLELIVVDLRKSFPFESP